MASSQPPSRDTVPLKYILCLLNYVPRLNDVSCPIGKLGRPHNNGEQKKTTFTARITIVSDNKKTTFFSAL
jgi:hypothetical protein